LSKDLIEKKGYRVFTIESCFNDNINIKRSFQQDDFIYKESGECPKCKSKMVITAIYAEPLKQS
jgi:erythromycin esterase-like protein